MSGTREPESVRHAVLTHVRKIAILVSNGGIFDQGPLKETTTLKSMGICYTEVLSLNCYIRYVKLHWDQGERDKIRYGIEFREY